MEVLSESVVIKIIGYIFGIGIMAYANKFSLKYFQKEFQHHKESDKEKYEEGVRRLETITSKIDILKTNQIKNCTDISHLKEEFGKLERRCYERHSE